MFQCVCYGRTEADKLDFSFIGRVVSEEIKFTVWDILSDCQGVKVKYMSKSKCRIMYNIRVVQYYYFTCAKLHYILNRNHHSRKQLFHYGCPGGESIYWWLTIEVNSKEMLQYLNVQVYQVQSVVLASWPNRIRNCCTNQCQRWPPNCVQVIAGKANGFLLRQLLSLRKLIPLRYNEVCERPEHADVLIIHTCVVLRMDDCNVLVNAINSRRTSHTTIQRKM